VTHSEFSKGAVKLNPYLLKSTVVAAIGGLLFGFDTAAIAGTTRACLLPFAHSASNSVTSWVSDIAGFKKAELLSCPELAALS
jgi:hypothetical protein